MSRVSESFQGLLVSALLLAAPQALVAEPSPHQKQPVIGLVLEGGGALGFAHVGVLKVLEEENIPVHVIAGTSMGSIVGAAYASGRSLEELEKVLAETDWDKLFDESIPRQLVDYRMKAGRDGELFGDSKLGVMDGEVILPTAIVEGQQIEPLLGKIFDRAPANCSFDDLPVRYRAVAADIETGQAVVLDKGNLALAARASMSVPGFFSPVEIDGRLLVDGGITNNFPVDVARSMGPDILIGVYFNLEPRKREKLKNPLAISAQILDFLLERSSAASRATMRPEDIIIHPDLREYSSTSFNSAREIMKAGEDAARAAIPRLRKLAVSQSEFRRWSQKRTAGAAYAPVIDYVRVEAPEPRKQAIMDAVSVKLGEAYDRDGTAKQIEAIHQTGLYKKVTVDVEEKDGKHGLVINAQEKEWLKRYLRLGMALEDNFDGQSNYALALNGRMRDLNEAGGYLDVQLEIGRSPRLFGEFYQPLSSTSRFFVAPEFTVQRQELRIRQDGDDIAQYDRESAVLGLKGGVTFRRYGELTGGWRWGPGRLERQIGEPNLPESSYDVGEFFTRFVVDQYDSPDFPTQGYRLSAEGTASREGAGASDDFEQSRLSVGLPVTFGENTFLLNGEMGNSSNDLPSERSFSLGGFFDISGFNKNSLVADNYWITRAMFYHRFAKESSALLKFGGFYGMSFEYASLRTSIQDIGDMPDIVAGSAFVGFDTPLLPVYFGFGLNDESEQSFYLAIGRVGSRRR